MSNKKDEKTMSMTPEEWSNMVEKLRKSRENELTAQTPTDKETLKKEAEARKIASNPNLKQEGETNEAFGMRVQEVNSLTRLEEQQKLEEESRLKKQKDVEFQKKEEDANLAYELQFQYETKEHTDMRHKIYEVSQSMMGLTALDKRFAPLLGELNNLRKQYATKHFEYPQSMTYEPIISYELQNGLVFLSKDKGKTWTIVDEDGHSTDKKPIIENGVPVGFYYNVKNMGLYGLLRPIAENGIFVDIHCIPKLPDEPKTTQKPVPRVLPTCDDIGQEHKFVLGVDKVSRCCLCGKVKEK